VMRLTGPSLAAMNGASLGGATVGSDGRWTGEKSDPVKIAGGKALLDVAAGSAAVITFT
jgi:hypothetical protein